MARPQVRARLIFVARDDDGLISHAYCTRTCGRKDDPEVELHPAELPRSGKGVTGFAVAVLTCDGCGGNLLELVEQVETARKV